MSKPAKAGKLRLQAKNSHGLDSISSLPDDTILQILSFLDMKAAGRACVLSKRWRYLWTKLIDLCFDGSEILLNDEGLELKQNRYVEWVNQVVGGYQSSHIHKFKVHFLLDNRHTSHIDKWVVFAIQKGVRNLELNLSNPLWGPGAIPMNLYAGSFSCFAGFKARLESLVLVGVNIGGPSLESILSNCCNLQSLSVRGNRCISSLKITGSPLKLRRLELSSCYNLKKLQIFAENLSSIIFCGGKIDVEYCYVPSLVEARFSGPYGSHLIRNFHHLSSFSFQLKKLSLLLTQMTNFPIGFPTFNNVKLLDLGVFCKDGDSLLFVLSYLEACPSLHHFILKLNWSEIIASGPGSEVEREAWKEAKSTHKNLKVVEFVGSIGGSSEVELALYLMNKYALGLEKVIFKSCNAISCSPFNSEKTNDPHVTMSRESRRRAIQVLGRVP